MSKAHKLSSPPRPKRIKQPYSPIPLEGKPGRILAALGAKDLPATKPHSWAVACVYLVDSDEEARALASTRPDLLDAESSIDYALPKNADGSAVEPVAVHGPYCPACRKVRGDGAETTLCGKKKPAWLESAEAERELEDLPRRQRRAIRAHERTQSKREPKLPPDVQHEIEKRERMKLPVNPSLRGDRHGFEDPSPCLPEIPRPETAKPERAELS